MVSTEVIEMRRFFFFMRHCRCFHSRPTGEDIDAVSGQSAAALFDAYPSGESCFKDCSASNETHKAEDVGNKGLSVLATTVPHLYLDAPMLFWGSSYHY